MKRRVSAMAAGVLVAMLPLMALAQEHEGSDFEAANRSMPPATDWGVIMLVTVVAVFGLFLVAGIGYGYRRVRGLDWPFQRPDAPADHH